MLNNTYSDHKDKLTTPHALHLYNTTKITNLPWASIFYTLLIK